MTQKTPLRYFLAILLLLLAGLSCGQPSAIRATATVSLTVATSTETPLPATSTTFPTPDPDALWYILRGGSKLDQGWGVDVDDAGNIFFATYQQDPGELFADMVIYKFSRDGSELWQTRWGGQFMEKAFIVVAQDEDVYVGGLTYTSAGLTESEMAVLALDRQDGHLIWEFTWGLGFGYQEVDGLVVDGESIYISGWTTGETTGNDAAILKLDLAGNLVWAQTWGTAGWDQADGQLVVTEDRLYIAGRYNGANILVGGQGYVASFSKDTGAYITHQTWGGPLFTDSLGMSGDGDYLLVVGLTLDRGNGGQIFLRKYDLDLGLVWEQLWGGAGSESARAVAVDSAGNIYVAGESDSQNRANGLDIVLLKYDPGGALLWTQTWGGSQNEGALGIVLDGSYLYIAANTRSFGSGQDEALLLKVDALGGQFPPTQ